jgi:diguanylate cyclase (GGDEF)-like protein
MPKADNSHMQHTWRQFVLRSPVAVTVTAVTGASVGLSVAALLVLTAALDLGFGGGFGVYLAVSIVIPLIVAAPVSWLIARLLREVEQARELAQALAWKDELTGLYNRRRFAELAQRELQLAARAGRPLAAVLIDLDNFKQVNDGHGHAVGDALLVAVGQGASQALRGTDLIARWGGEEFAVVLPDAGADEAVQLVERLLQVVRDLRLPLPEEAWLQCTASMGVAIHAGDGESFQALIDRADQAMYEAKVGGKNRLVLAQAAG